MSHGTFPLPRLDRQTSTYGALTKTFNNNNNNKYERVNKKSKEVKLNGHVMESLQSAIHIHIHYVTFYSVTYI